MISELRRLLEEIIDRSIRLCPLEEPATFSEIKADLDKVETSILALSDMPEKIDLMSQLQAHRIFLASEAHQNGDVLELSEAFLRVRSATPLDLFNVVAARSDALHALGRHGDEIREAVEIAQWPELNRSEFVLLLEKLALRHPGSMGAEPLLLSKMQEAVTDLRATGYTSLPAPPLGRASVEQLALEVAAELRRLNRARAEALLAGDVP